MVGEYVLGVDCPVGCHIRRLGVKTFVLCNVKDGIYRSCLLR